MEYFLNFFKVCLWWYDGVIGAYDGFSDECCYCFCIFCEDELFELFGALCCEFFFGVIFVLMVKEMRIVGMKKFG